MSLPLRLSEAQQLHDGVHDILLRAALEAFFAERRAIEVENLLMAVKKHQRDNQMESRIAGKIEAYEGALRDMEHFAKEQLVRTAQ